MRQGSLIYDLKKAQHVRNMQ